MKRKQISKKRFYHPKSSFNQKVQTFGNVARTASSALAVGKLAFSLINPEFKWKDTASTITLNTTYSTILLNGLVQGTDAGNRIGRSIKVKSLELSFLVSRNIADTAQHSVRIMLVLDKEPKATIISASDVLTDTSYYINSPRNLNNKNQYVILKDWKLPLPANGGTEVFIRDYYRKFDLHTTYNNGNLGGITDIESNALYLIMVSDATANLPSITYFNRIRYLDN